MSCYHSSNRSICILKAQRLGAPWKYCHTPSLNFLPLFDKFYLFLIFLFIFFHIIQTSSTEWRGKARDHSNLTKAESNPLPFAMGDGDIHLIEGFLGPHESPPETGRRSVQPFFHITKVAWQTDWHTAPRNHRSQTRNMHVAHSMWTKTSRPQRWEWTQLMQQATQKKT